MTAELTAFLVGFLIWPALFIAAWVLHKVWEKNG